jgi:F-type H+-transporting ATPase subunit b
MRIRAVVLGLLLAFGGVAGPATVAAAQESGSKPLSHAAQECIDVLESGKEPVDCLEAPSPIKPATNELFWGGTAFVILLLIMWKFAYPGVKKGMEARTERIRESLDEAERTKAEAQRILEDYQRQLADAKNESARIVDDARQTAEQMRRDLMVRAEAEAAELRERTRQEIEGAKHRALADLRSEVSELAIGAAEVVVQRNLDRDTNRALVERFIEQVGASA